MAVSRRHHNVCNILSSAFPQLKSRTRPSLQLQHQNSRLLGPAESAQRCSLLALVHNRYCPPQASRPEPLSLFCGQEHSKDVCSKRGPGMNCPLPNPTRRLSGLSATQRSLFVFVSRSSGHATNDAGESMIPPRKEHSVADGWRWRRSGEEAEERRKMNGLKAVRWAQPSARRPLPT